MDDVEEGCSCKGIHENIWHEKYCILILYNIIRNKRDSRFFPGNKPAGILGITKKLLFFIENHVNGIGFQVYKALDCKFGVLRSPIWVLQI